MKWSGYFAIIIGGQKKQSNDAHDKRSFARMRCAAHCRRE